ncbi:MAG: formate dehydrogenase accessory sulfurtransferase FdhD [Proteobacteria bacterium]|nr:formate dehydrogenase accessory sulfurtransferase FdhD [Pseudomonadota bacterium]
MLRQCLPVVEVTAESGYRPCRAISVAGGKAKASEEYVAEEVPVAMVYNGISHAVMLATPSDLEDFAVGFSLTEEIVVSRDEIFDINTDYGSGGIEVKLTIAGDRMRFLKEKRRNLTGRTGCGICGAENLAHALRHPRPLSRQIEVQGDAVHAAFDELSQLQQLHHITGAVHAAAFATAKGQVQVVREDVGRHNALDKLIGALAFLDLDAGSGMALITSRASYEMVQKSVTAGISLLAAISAPTSLAVRMAGESGLTLLGFTRNRQHVVYSHAERVIEKEEKGYEG